MGRHGPSAGEESGRKPPTNRRERDEIATVLNRLAAQADEWTQRIEPGSSYVGAFGEFATEVHPPIQELSAALDRHGLSRHSTRLLTRFSDALAQLQRLGRLREADGTVPSATAIGAAEPAEANAARRRMAEEAAYRIRLVGWEARRIRDELQGKSSERIPPPAPGDAGALRPAGVTAGMPLDPRGSERPGTVGEDAGGRLRGAPRTSYSYFQDAVRVDPGLSDRTDREVFDYLAGRRAEYERLPESFETFARYLRTAREALGQQKHRPRVRPPSSGSIVNRRDLE